MIVGNQMDELQGIFQVEMALEDKLDSLKTEADQLGESVSAEIISSALKGNTNLPVSAARVTSVGNEISICERALNEARKRRLEAIRVGFLNQAEAMRKKATQLEVEHADIVRRTQPLLKKLAEIEGVAFDRSILQMQRHGNWFSAFGPVGEDTNPRRISADVSSGFLETRSAKILLEVEKLRSKADETDERQVQLSGSVQADSLEALMGEVFSDLTRIAPFRHEIEEWVGSQLNKLAAKTGTVPEAFQIMLSWRNAQIDIGNSSLLPVRRMAA